MGTRLLARFAVVLGVGLGTSSVAAAAAIITVDGATLSTDRVVITVTGRYTLGPAAPNSQTQAYLSVEQASGTGISGGNNRFEPIADGVEHSFQINVHTSNRPYHGGKARITGSVFYSDCSTCCPCQSESGSTDVQVAVRVGGK